MSYTGMGKIPPYQDISHFRAPYKNSIFAGFGVSPAMCVAPKWQYNEITDSCICAPGYLPTPDGSDCIPIIGTPIYPEPSTGSSLVDPVTGEPLPTPAPAPGSAAAPAACTGYTMGSTCVPKWAVWGGGALLALLVVDMVL